MKFKDFKPPRIVKGPKRWYIEYSYRIPPTALHLYPDQEWLRVKVFRNINRYQGEEQEEYAVYLLNSLKAGLHEGNITPFTVILDALKSEDAVEIKRAASKPITLSTALEKFSQYAQDKGLRKSTLQNYGTAKNMLHDYFLAQNNRLYQPLASFKREDMKTFIWGMKMQKGWNNYTYNNYIGFCKTIFNWFVKEEYLEKSPFAGMEDLPVNITTHRYYDHKTAEEVKSKLLTQDPYMFKYCQFVYYTGTRPKSETPKLKVGNILFDRNLIFIPAHVSKNKKDDYIYLDPMLKEMLLPWMNAPKEYYLFSALGEPSPNMASANYFATRYKPFKDGLKLSEDYTIYSWKHTRAIDLAEAGADPYEIMKLFRHYSLEMTMKYLRDLGCNMRSEISVKSKKF